MPRPVPLPILVFSILVSLAAGCPVDDDDVTGDDDIGDDDTGDDDTTAAAPVTFVCTEPVSLGEPINSSSSEMGPSLSPDGLRLYFSSGREGGAGSADIWVAERAVQGEPWGEPWNLGAPVNGSGGQTNPVVSPDGAQLVYGGNRNGNYDLWAHDREGDGWGMPYCLDTLASDDLENKPAFSWDGGELFFKRSDPSLVSNIWASSWLGDDWGEAELVTDLNDDRAQTDPAPDPAGDVMFFVQGNDTESPFDVFYAVRDGEGWGWITPLPGVSIDGAKDEGIYVGPDGREFLMVSNRDDPADKELYTFTCERAAG
ncbi:MAG: hypothetical protein QGH45_25020 [Myxococcota bacterium]|jgi:hypothetical protein|nr:hypothetical protein [Myxococcota bacterium]